jgi:hypothetical protein
LAILAAAVLLMPLRLSAWYLFQLRICLPGMLNLNPPTQDTTHHPRVYPEAKRQLAPSLDYSFLVHHSPSLTYKPYNSLLGYHIVK